jgi:hypothetical protein
MIKRENFQSCKFLEIQTTVWRPMEKFCTVMLMDVTPDDEYSPDETYYLLSDVLPEDRELREGLQEKRLVISYKKG